MCECVCVRVCVRVFGVCVRVCCVHVRAPVHACVGTQRSVCGVWL